MRYLLLFIAWVVALGAMHFTYGLARLLDPVGLMAVFLPLMMCIVFHVRSERVEWSAFVVGFRSAARIACSSRWFYLAARC